MQRRSQTRILVECALCVAIACVLSEIKFELPYGGSITAFSMVPILLASFRNGTKWGVLTSFVYSLVQLFLGFKNVLYCKTLGAQTLCILFDYVVAFTVLGLALALATPFGGVKSRFSVGAGSALAILLRFVCHFLSGVYVFGYTGKIWEKLDFVAENKYIYSALYNGAYMLPEIILTVAGAVVLYSVKPIRNLLTPKDEQSA